MSARGGFGLDLPDYPWNSLAPYRAQAGEHADGVVDLSIGTPVDPTPLVVQDALAAAADAPGYPTTHGTPALREAVAAWYAERRSVPGLDPDAVMPTVGSKELVAWLPLLLGLGPGDAVVRPVVAYPTYDIGARLAGAERDLVTSRAVFSARGLDKATAVLLDRLDALAPVPAGARILDLGCGPGHVTAYLRDRGGDAVGVDLSGSMIQIAREDHPGIRFETQSMTALDVPDDAVGAAVLLFSLTHLSPADRDAALAEVHRVLRPGGVALVSFHIRSEEVEAGETWHLTSWFGKSVDLDGHYLDPEVVMAELLRVGFDVGSVTTRMPHPGIEVQTERAYLLAQKPERPPV